MHVELPVDVVIVAYGHEDLLGRCLEALGGGRAVTVVDNSSSEAVRTTANGACAVYIDARRNIGFGAGVNVALRAGAGSGRDLLLLNPDARIRPDDVVRLVTWLHEPEQHRVGVCSPCVIDEDGLNQRVSWPFPSPRRAWLEALGLSARWASDAQFVIGAAMLIRREALADVGAFDERFFLYAEETDWQRRARSRGWQSAVCPLVAATHLGAGTSDDPRRREAFFHSGQEIYIRKWFGTAGWISYRTAVVLGALARAAVLPGARRSAALERALLYIRGPRRIAGLSSAR